MASDNMYVCVCVEGGVLKGLRQLQKDPPQSSL